VRRTARRNGRNRLIPVKIADVIAAPFPVSPRSARKADLDARARRGGSAPGRFERQVFGYLRKHGREHGIAKVSKLGNVLVDGTLVLKNRRCLIVEAKYRMGWLKACQADWQVGAFLRLPEGRRCRASGALVIFEEFSGDWARHRKSAAQKEDEGRERVVPLVRGSRPAPGPATLPPRSCTVPARPTGPWTHAGRRGSEPQEDGRTLRQSRKAASPRHFTDAAESWGPLHRRRGRVGDRRPWTTRGGKMDCLAGPR
jgi:hypothetical protein